MITQNPNNAILLLSLIAPSRADDTESWQQICISLKNCGVDYEAFQQWSLTGEYNNEKQIQRAWNNLEGNYSIGTLAHYAKIDNGSIDHSDFTDTYSLIPKQPVKAPQRAVMNGRQVLKNLINKNHDISENDYELWERSPYKINWGLGIDDTVHALKQLYKPEDILFIGQHLPKYPFNCKDDLKETLKLKWQDSCIKPISKWLDVLREDSNILNDAPFIRPNPLSGEQVKIEAGKYSLIADKCVKSFKFSIVEFDDISLQDQTAFWLSMLDAGLPVAALIFSGSKSIHGWIAVDCKSRDDWTLNVENKLYRQYLEPLGVDPACKNESRLSRTPGAFRTDKKQFQRLIYLNPDAGRRVAA